MIFKNKLMVYIYIYIWFSTVVLYKKVEDISKSMNYWKLQKERDIILGFKKNVLL